MTLPSRVLELPIDLLNSSATTLLVELEDFLYSFGASSGCEVVLAAVKVVGYAGQATLKKFLLSLELHPELPLFVLMLLQLFVKCDLVGVALLHQRVVGSL